MVQLINNATQQLEMPPPKQKYTYHHASQLPHAFFLHTKQQTMLIISKNHSKHVLHRTDHNKDKQINDSTVFVFYFLFNCNKKKLKLEKQLARALF